MLIEVRYSKRAQLLKVNKMFEINYILKIYFKKYTSYDGLNFQNNFVIVS